MKNFAKISFLLFFCISSCYYPIKSNSEQSAPNFPSHYIFTKPIYFYLDDEDEVKSKAYLLLFYNIHSNKYYMKLRWMFYNNNRAYIYIKNSMKMTLDERLEFTFSAIKPPKVVKINLEPKGIEEELLIEIDRHSLELIAQAGKVELEVRARMHNLKGKFMKKHTFEAFAEFLDKVDKEVEE